MTSTPSTARIERLVTAGLFSLDGQDFEVENNVWLVGDADEVLVVDAAHDPAVQAALRARVTALANAHPLYPGLGVVV